MEHSAWASRANRFSEAFEELSAYLWQVTNRTQVHRLLGISWETVRSIVARVVARRLDPGRLSGLGCIGIDEFSYRKRHRYLTLVVDHIVWCRPAKAEALTPWPRSSHCSA